MLILARTLRWVTVMNLILSITDLPESSGLLYVGFGLIVLAILLRRVFRPVQASADPRVQDAPQAGQI